MSEPKFTPGPWRWKGEDYRGGWGWQLLVGPNGEGLVCGEDSNGPYKHLKAFVPIDPKHCETAPGVHVLEADAHLIAAAPDLYRKLELARFTIAMEIATMGPRTLEREEKEALIAEHPAIKLIDSALAKARGEG